MKSIGAQVPDNSSHRLSHRRELCYRADMTSIIARILSIFTGGSSPSVAQAPVAEPQVYKDCLIHAEPIREGSQYRLAGRIVKEVAGRTLERTFIRADVFTSLDDALECTFRKAHQIVDQNGSSLFADGEEKRSA